MGPIEVGNGGANVSYFSTIDTHSDTFLQRLTPAANVSYLAKKKKKRKKKPQSATEVFANVVIYPCAALMCQTNGQGKNKRNQECDKIFTSFW